MDFPFQSIFNTKKKEKKYSKFKSKIHSRGREDGKEMDKYTNLDFGVTLPGLLQFFTSFIIRVRPKQILNDLPI